MPSYDALLQDLRTRTPEIDGANLVTLHATVIDVREADEHAQGAIPGAVWIPRGFLESRIEKTVADRAAPVVVYCAGGVRSAFAARTLQELGFSDVVSMAGGFGRWKDEGRLWRTPVTLSAEAASWLVAVASGNRSGCSTWSAPSPPSWSTEAGGGAPAAGSLLPRTPHPICSVSDATKSTPGTLATRAWCFTE